MIQDETTDVFVDNLRNENKSFKVYILQLRGNRFYVGHTGDTVISRYSQHSNGAGSNFTREFGSLGIIGAAVIVDRNNNAIISGRSVPGEALETEKSITLEMIRKYGDKVRGEPELPNNMGTEGDWIKEYVELLDIIENHTCCLCYNDSDKHTAVNCKNKPHLRELLRHTFNAPQIAIAMTKTQLREAKLFKPCSKYGNSSSPSPPQTPELPTMFSVVSRILGKFPNLSANDRYSFTSFRAIKSVVSAENERNPYDSSDNEFEMNVVLAILKLTKILESRTSEEVESSAPETTKSARASAPEASTPKAARASAPESAHRDPNVREKTGKHANTSRNKEHDSDDDRDDDNDDNTGPTLYEQGIQNYERFIRRAGRTYSWTMWERRAVLYIFNGLGIDVDEFEPYLSKGYIKRVGQNIPVAIRDRMIRILKRHYDNDDNDDIDDIYSEAFEDLHSRQK